MEICLLDTAIGGFPLCRNLPFSTSEKKVLDLFLPLILGLNGSMQSAHRDGMMSLRAGLKSAGDGLSTRLILFSCPNVAVNYSFTG